jgi:hypothetical protein
LVKLSNEFSYSVLPSFATVAVAPPLPIAWIWLFFIALLKEE